MSEVYDFDKVKKPCPFPIVGTQEATVCVPVTVSPFAKAGPVKVQLCGPAKIKYGCARCRGKVNDSCEFTISQKVKVDVPVDVGAKVCIGETFVDCECNDGKPRFDYDLKSED